ncbi:MAG TPA: aspartyl protease family protein [Candidatus Eremiobacteraceae bacterium]|nr:aspartyl protease family protein [Candidatus Eremiobacteraceae bacterium]
MQKMTPAQVLGCLLIYAALLPSAAWARDTYSQPEGISGTTVRLEDLLLAARKADGGDKAPVSIVEEGHVTAWGLNGTFRVVTVGGDFKWTTDLGVAVWGAGSVNGVRWRQNPNGVVTQLHDLYPVLDAASIPQYRRYSVSDLALLGETGGADAAYVVEAHPRGGRLMWLFFHKKTHLIARAELAFPTERVTYTYSDFRKTGSFTDAWHVRSSDGYPPNDIDYLTRSKKYNVPSTQADTAMPLQNDKLVVFPSGSSPVKLPSRLSGENDSPSIVSRQDFTQSTSQAVGGSGLPGAGSSGVGQGPSGVGANGTLSDTTRGAAIISKVAGKNVVLQLTINGRAYDFYLDTGASGVLIDSDVVTALGLKTFGPLVQTKFGNWIHSFAIIPQMSAGGVTMTNLIAFSRPFHEGPHVGTKVVGLLGYDFIANAVLTIDYVSGTVMATNPFLFVPPADAMAVPATLDGGQPHIPVQIGQVTSDRFILDTGSPNCFIFSAFAHANPQEVADQGKGVDVNRVWMPWYGFSGVDVPELSLRATEVKSVAISGVTFNDWLMFMTLPQSRAWEGEGADGIIGYDFLKYFTVYLDYPQNEIFLAPNALGKSRLQH